MELCKKRKPGYEYLHSSDEALFKNYKHRNIYNGKNNNAIKRRNNSFEKCN